MKLTSILLCLLLSGCGSCLDPWNHLSDCPSWSHNPGDYIP